MHAISTQTPRRIGNYSCGISTAVTNPGEYFALTNTLKEESWVPSLVLHPIEVFDGIEVCLFVEGTIDH
jgi:hypothetical protein